MERIINGYEGFERVDSDLCSTIYGGSGFWAKVAKFLVDNLDQFLLGFIEGWTGQEIIGSITK